MKMTTKKATSIAAGMLMAIFFSSAYATGDQCSARQQNLCKASCAKSNNTVMSCRSISKGKDNINIGKDRINVDDSRLATCMCKPNPVKIIKNNKP